ncbi:MAG: hypothetical protein RI920_1106, partial [Pseudomonadota bacterium]
MADLPSSDSPDIDPAVVPVGPAFSPLYQQIKS